MENSKIQRINELSKKSKTVGLTDEEKKEQQLLRQQYIAEFRGSLQSTLENIVVVDKEGNKAPLKKKNTEKEKH